MLAATDVHLCLQLGSRGRAVLVESELGKQSCIQAACLLSKKVGATTLELLLKGCICCCCPLIHLQAPLQLGVCTLCAPSSRTTYIVMPLGSVNLASCMFDMVYTKVPGRSLVALMMQMCVSV